MYDSLRKRQWKICAVCGIEFLAHYPDQKTCSYKCSGIGFRKIRQPKECLSCRETYYPPPNRYVISKYCSQACFHVEHKKYRGTHHPLYRGKIKKKCIYCGKEYLVNLGRSLSARFCSKSCHYQSMGIRLSCEYCGREIRRSPSSIIGDKHHYCSKRCHGLGIRTISNRPCLNCGRIYKPTYGDFAPTFHYESKFCCRSCMDEYKRNKTILICRECGKPFQTRKYLNNTAIYCSRECHYKSIDSNIKAYRTRYLKGITGPVVEKYMASKILQYKLRRSLNV